MILIQRLRNDWPSESTTNTKKENRFRHPLTSRFTHSTRDQPEARINKNNSERCDIPRLDSRSYCRPRIDHAAL